MGTKCSLFETSHTVTFYRKPFEPRKSHGVILTVYPIQRDALRRAAEMISLEREETQKKKEERGSFVSRIADR